MNFSGSGGIRLLFEPQFSSDEDRRRHEVETLRQRVQQLEDGPIAFAVILEVSDGHAMLATGNGMMVELARPPKMDLRKGQIVRLRSGHPQLPPAIVGVATNYARVGRTFAVRSIIDDGVEVEVAPGQNQIVMCMLDELPRAGDRVVLDQSGQTVVRNLGQGDKTSVVEHATGVCWEDIGGQDEAKQELIEAIEWPVTHAETYAQFKLTPSRGVLLWGPPGCGKTMLGKACATALARVHHKTESSTGFLYVKGPDILRGIVGESEKQIRELFTQARVHHEEHGYPAILFIDEADAILTKRGMSLHQGMERTIVPQFLSEMDGLFASCAFVLLATNRPDTLDPAVVREGRVDRKIEIKRPTRQAAKDIATRRLVGRPCGRGGEETRAQEVVTELFDDRHALYMIRCRDGRDRRFALCQVVSGAMVASVVERATQLAIRRVHKGGSVGLMTEDVREAVAAVIDEQRAIDYGAELEQFCKPFKEMVVKIDRPNERDSEPLIKLH